MKSPNKILQNIPNWTKATESECNFIIEIEMRDLL